MHRWVEHITTKLIKRSLFISKKNIFFFFSIHLLMRQVTDLISSDLIYFSDVQYVHCNATVSLGQDLFR